MKTISPDGREGVMKAKIVEVYILKNDLERSIKHLLTKIKINLSRGWQIADIGALDVVNGKISVLVEFQRMGSPKGREA